MAHFLSEATHQRLELRDVPDETGDESQQYSTGVTKTHVMWGAMRCFAVVGNCHSDDARGLAKYEPDRTPFSATMRRSLRQGALDVTEGVDQQNIDPMPRLQIWSGDTVGSVTARVGLVGAPQHVVHLPKDRGVYAYSVHHHEPYVWVGMSDGFLCIYDANSGDRVCEMRAHTASINVITSVGNYVFTAGSDWQIYQWDPVELKRVPHGQLSGHQNSVRCLTGTTADSSASGVLYSGGDDYVIRCWDLDTGYERADPWPIIGHEGTVRGLAVHGVYLFSASNDGTVKAWNTQTAQLVRTLDDRGPNVAVAALAVDPAAPSVWSGGTDGVLRMWNAQSLVLVGERTDHHATHVAKISPVGRANAVKAWMLDANGTLTTVFSDPDGACSTTGQGGYKALQPMESDLQRQVDTSRVKILQNYAELERCRDEFDEMQAKERENKGKYAVAVARNRSKMLSVTFNHQAAEFLNRRRAATSSKRRADAMACIAEMSIRRRFMAQWLRFIANRGDDARRKSVLSIVTAARNSALAARYARMLVDHERKARANALRNNIASSFASQNSALVQRVAFWRWHRCARTRVLAKQRGPFARATAKVASSSLLATYWAKLRHSVVVDRAQTALRSTIAVLDSQAPSPLLRRYWTKWSQAKHRRCDACTKDGSVTILSNVTDREVVSAYFLRWMTQIRRSTMVTLKARLDEENGELSQIREQVVASEGVNEEALESALAAKQRELAALRQEETAWDARLRKVAQRKRALQREALRHASIDSDEPLIEQISTAMYLLKARGVNVKANEEDILQARQGVSDSDAATVFAEGIGMVRKVCAAVIKPTPLTDPGDLCWFPGSMFSRITEKQVLKASQGLARMVTAFDMMNVKQLGQQWLTPPTNGRQTWARPQFAEAIVNLSTLLELAIRAHRVRRGEDMHTGGPKPELRVRARSKSRGRSKSTGRKSGGTTTTAGTRKKSKSRPSSQKPKKPKATDEAPAAAADAEPKPAPAAEAAHIDPAADVQEGDAAAAPSAN